MDAVEVSMVVIGLQRSVIDSRANAGIAAKIVAQEPSVPREAKEKARM